MKPSILWLTFLILTVATPAFGGQWQTFADAELVPNRYFDGDSFHIRTQSSPGARPYTYVFRLYGADCPEVDNSFPARIAEQAKAFKTTPERVVKWGRLAKDAVEKKFSEGKSIRVLTRKTKASGMSSKNRYYARVIVDDVDLAEWLVENGYARAYGFYEDFPKSESAERYRRKLRSKESQARNRKVGIWGPN